jgi:2-haloalkanoic acid dehalogenase type II
VGDVVSNLNTPAALSEAEPVPPHPRHHEPSAGRTRTLDGPPPPFRPYRDEWPEHFAICFEELGLPGDGQLAYEQLRDSIGAATAFPEAHRVVETVSRRLPTALLSNADDDFLLPCLARNGLVFPVVLSSESCRAYKPHFSIFETLGRELGLPHENILYVGDSRFADVAGAKHAGLQAAWINRPGVKPIESTGAAALEAERRELPDADYEIDSLEGVLAALGEQGVR